MERQDAMTRRPSLLAGGHEPAHGTPLREQILPSIDAPRADAATDRPARARPWMLVGLLVLVALAATWLWSLSPVPDDAGPVARGADPVAQEAAAGAATIIEDATLPTEVARDLPRIPGGAPGTTASATGVPAPASPFAALASGGTGTAAPNPFGSGRAPAATPARPRQAAASAQGENPALLATLLDHIRTPPEQESGMDRMVDQLAGDGTVASPQASAPASEFRSHQIQWNLRECPPANTAEGVACRKKICEVYAGRDPACPAG